MKATLLFTALLFLFACNTKSADEYEKPKDSLDCFINFVHAIQKGNFDVAKHYVLSDSDNVYLLQKVADTYNKYTDEKKETLRNSSIITKEITPVDDSNT